MYLEFFGLDDYPFDGLPDRRFYYVGGAQHQSLGLLTTALSRSGNICVLSGSSGAGKTTLVRMLMRSLPRRMRIISIDDPRLDPHMLLATILRASGVVATSLESIAELTLKLRQMLEKSISMGIITTVICDEAQGLSDDVLEQIRLISNIEGEVGKMINFLLVGQEDLVAHLNKPEHDMLKNRIKIFAVLPKLREEEVGAYLTYRLQQSSCMQPIFTNRAIRIIAKKSNGTPRLINAIADMCLTLAFESKKKQVNSFIALKAAHLVRYNRAGFKEILLSYLKNFMRASVYGRLLLLIASFGCAVGAYVGALYLMENVYPLKTVQESLLTDQDIQKRYEQVSEYLFNGRQAESRELSYFNRAVSGAYFRSDALKTLLKIHGYAPEDQDVPINDSLLEEVGLQSFVQVGGFDEAISFNSPILIELIDDNLTPFYTILYQINDDVAYVVIGDYMFGVKIDYLRERYGGSYTLFHPYVGDFSELSSRKTDVRKAAENRLRPYLSRYVQRSLESANREANLVLAQYDRQVALIDKIKREVKERVLKSMSTQGLSDKQVEEKLTTLFEEELKKDHAYIVAREHLAAIEKNGEERESYVRSIRSISLKLDGGYERAITLFLEEQNFKEFNRSAIAQLTLAFSDSPRLINVVDVNNPSTKLGLPAVAPKANKEQSNDKAQGKARQNEKESKNSGNVKIAMR